VEHRDQSGTDSDTGIWSSPNVPTERKGNLMPVTQAEIEAADKAVRAVESRFGITIAWELRNPIIKAALEAAERARWQPKIAPSGLQICPHCKKEWREGGTCGMGGCPMGGDF
jgi:hypothetical protein